jgi:7-cyano-7-deazaguanine synthase
MDSSGAKKAVVLLSGGLDSATVLAIAQADGFACHAISLRYGQRHELELAAAKKVAERAGVVEHITIDLNLRPIAASALTREDIPIPKGRSAAEMAGAIPATYVPARNTIFLSFAMAWAETLAAADIFLGVNALDYSGYPDCRPEYIAAYEKMANLATRAGVERHEHLAIHTPLIQLTKGQIITRGLALGVDYSLTSTCYDATSDGACGQCDACLLRLKGFAENGIVDPIRYRSP